MKATALNAANGTLVEELSPNLVPALIGWRSLRRDGAARDKNLYGFSATAHALARTCRQQGHEVHAFICPGDGTAQAHPRSFDVRKAGTVEDNTPMPLDAVPNFAAAGALVPLAESAIVNGGRIVRDGVHINDTPRFGYDSLWHESERASVANLTRANGLGFLPVAQLRGAVVLLP